MWKKLRKLRFNGNIYIYIYILYKFIIYIYVYYIYIYIYGFEWLGIWKSMSWMNHPKQSVNHPKCGAHQFRSILFLYPVGIHSYLAVHTLWLLKTRRKTHKLCMKMRQIPAKFIWDSPETMVSPWSENRKSSSLSYVSMGHGFQFSMLSNHRVRIPTKPPEKCFFNPSFQ